LAESGPLVIATHDGSFHADDVFGVAIARTAFQYLRPRRTIQLLRTRDPALLTAAHIVLDVGGLHDGATRFDHHQAAGAGAREDGVPFAAAGLVWSRYGMAFLQDVLPEDTADVTRLAIWSRVDQDLIRHLDAADNGVTLGPQTGMSISDLIAQFNPTWLDTPHSAAMFQAAFDDATETAYNILVNACHMALAKEAAQTVVLAGARNGGPVLLLEQGGIPWQEAVIEHLPEVLLVVAPAGGEVNSWRVQTVPVGPGSFTSRLDLPAAWAGLEGEALSKATGVPGCAFAHRGRFVAGNATREGALRLATLALRPTPSAA
jgi:uncharacterized UPF0160 family protein